MNTVLFVNATIGFSENLFLVKYVCSKYIHIHTYNVAEGLTSRIYISAF